MRALLSLCAGFMLAVLWFDLMFDVQVLSGDGARSREEALVSIAAYYRRVTTRARPMTYLVGVVMLVMVGGTMLQLVRGGGRLPARLGALALCLVPVVAAQVRTFPNAVRLGARVDPPEVQARLARAICRDHLVFLPAMAVFAALQLVGP